MYISVIQVIAACRFRSYSGSLSVKAGMPASVVDGAIPDQKQGRGGLRADRIPNVGGAVRRSRLAPDCSGSVTALLADIPPSGAKPLPQFDLRRPDRYLGSVCPNPTLIWGGLPKFYIEFRPAWLTGRFQIKSKAAVALESTAFQMWEGLAPIAAVQLQLCWPLHTAGSKPLPQFDLHRSDR